MGRILANQEINGKVTGQVLLGGEPFHKRDHSHRVAFVRDVDTHYAHLTVQETFEFAHALLFPGTDAKKRADKISLILRILGLSHRADTIVGDNLTRGVSGGERRRVTIGVELLKRCQLLVLDEATTGLDSATSLQIFRALRVVSDEVAPVITFLKQPGRELFALFDKIIILHRGSIVYNGPGDNMMNFFESQGYEVDKSINPADEILRLLDTNGDELIEVYNQQNPCPIEEKIAKSKGKQVVYNRYSQSWPVQFYWVVKRGFQLIKNQPSIAVSRVMFALIMAFIVGTLYLQLGNNQASITSMQGALFIVSTFPSFQPVLASLPTVFSTRPIFYYQRENHYFHAIPMLCAEFVVNAPIIIIESVIFSTVCYWLIGFNSIFVRFLYFLIMVVNLEIFFSIFTKICGFILPTFLIANITVPPLIFMLNFFTGFAVIERRAPDYMQWIYYISPFRYLLEGLSINEFYGQDYFCDDDEFVPPSSSIALDAPYALGGFEGNQVCPITTGEQILELSDYQTEYAYAWYWFLVLLLFIIIGFFVMIITSYFKYKDRPLRDIKADRKRRSRENFIIQLFKQTICFPCYKRKSNDDSDDIDNDDSNHKLTRNVTISSGMGPIKLEVDDVYGEGTRMKTNIPIYLEWKNISYKVKVLPKSGIMSKLGNFPCFAPFALQDLPLLHNLSGYAKPGMLIAFMGSSGAGKTTLLDVLAQRKTAGDITGEILINGAPIDPETLPRFSGYVEQQNIHVMSETVEEALQFSAALRLSYPKGCKKENFTRHELIAHVIWVMNILQLTEFRHVLIGELSLEQKKRVTIGVELAANPSLLFLDEPTSGLDSIAALRVMKAVKAIADSGVAVLCTLHQPSEVLFGLFSHLILLARGGHIVYFGDISNGYEESIEHFSQFGMNPFPGQNIADFYLDCCASDSKNESGESISEGYKHSIAAKDLEDTLGNGLVPKVNVSKKRFYHKYLPCFGPSNEEGAEIPLPLYNGICSRYPLPQWSYLTSRNVRMWWRSPWSVVIIFANAIMFGLILGLLYSETDNTQEGIKEHITLYFFLIVVLSTSVMTYIPQIFDERAIFYRELSSRTYTAVTYLVSLVSVCIPMMSIYGIIVMLLIFLIADLDTYWYEAGYYFGMGSATFLTSFFLALFLCSISAEAELGNGLYSLVNLLSTYVNGFLLISTEIPVYWIWMYWISFHHYSLEGMLNNALRDETFVCATGEGIPVPVPSETNPYRFQFVCPYTSGEDVLESLEMHTGWILIDILIMCGFVLGMFTLTAIVMTKVKHIQR